MTTVAGGPRHVDGQLLRSVLRAHAAGVVVVTGRDEEGQPVGFTASSFVPVSLDPPLVGVLVGRAASVLPSLRPGRWAAVHLLGEDQVELARRFAGPAAQRFDGLRVGPVGAPTLPSARAYVIGHVDRVVETGDHLLVLVAVTAAWRDPAASAGPLLHLERGYATTSA